MDWERDATRRVTRVIKRSVNYPGIKYVGQAMTLNLSQTLHDLNHHYHHHRPSRFRAFRSKTPRRRFLGLAATCRTYRGIPHLVVVPAATPSFASPLPSPPSRHSFLARSTILSRFTAYLAIPRSHPAYRDDVLYLLPFVSLSSALAPPSAFLFREASQFQTCQF